MAEYPYNFKCIFLPVPTLGHSPENTCGDNWGGKDKKADF